MKTLFISAPGVAGVLVEKTGRRRRQSALKFKDAHAALDWCQMNASAMVYLPAGADPAELLSFAA